MTVLANVIVFTIMLSEKCTEYLLRIATPTPASAAILIIVAMARVIGAIV